MVEIERKFNPNEWLREVSVAYSDKLGEIRYRKITGADMVRLGHFQSQLEKNPPSDMSVEEYMLCYQMWLMIKGGGNEISFEDFMRMDPQVFAEIVNVLTEAADFRENGSVEKSS